MFSIICVFLAALVLEVLCSAVSVIGVAKTFSGDPLTLAIAIGWDVCKIIAVSAIYNYWPKMGWWKYPLLALTFCTMLITSYGVAGYYYNKFDTGMTTLNQNQITIEASISEQTRLQDRKKQIDKQIADLPANYAKARTKLQQTFAGEVDHINKRLVELDSEIPKLQSAQITTSVDAGPIPAITKALDITPQHALNIVLSIIIFVSDPFAIILVILGNFLIALRREKIHPPEPVLFDPDLAQKNIDISNKQLADIGAPIPQPTKQEPTDSIDPEKKTEFFDEDEELVRADETDDEREEWLVDYQTEEPQPSTIDEPVLNEPEPSIQTPEDLKRIVNSLDYNEDPEDIPASNNEELPISSLTGISDGDHDIDFGYDKNYKKTLPYNIYKDQKK